MGLRSPEPTGVMTRRLSSRLGLVVGREELQNVRSEDIASADATNRSETLFSGRSPSGSAPSQAGTEFAERVEATSRNDARRRNVFCGCSSRHSIAPRGIDRCAFAVGWEHRYDIDTEKKESRISLATCGDMWREVESSPRTRGDV